MKNTIFLAIVALFITASVNAQSTVDSIAAKYKLLPMPEALTVEKTFPVLGNYQLSNAADSSASAPGVTISLDSANKGIVWVEGLPVGRFKAYLRKSPATYRIVSQKTESGKQIPEGTLMLDATTNTLNVALGAAYNETDPAAIFAFSNGVAANDAVEVKAKSKNVKTKAKVNYYTATKVVPVTNTTNPAVDSTQQQKADSTQQGGGQQTGGGTQGGGQQ